MVQHNGGRKRAALVAVSRHLLRLMYAVARGGVPFDRAPSRPGGRRPIPARA
jgi:hypothetical protein